MANTSLTKRDMRFKWTPETEVFVIGLYAEFLTASQISTQMLRDMAQELKSDTERHGDNEVRSYLTNKIYHLRPKQLKVRDKYQELFNEKRKEFLEGVNSCYLSHRKNRMQELDELYTVVMNRIIGPNTEGNDFKGEVQAAITLIREARAEMSSSKVSVEASVVDGNATLALRSNVENLTDSQIKELMTKHERGEPISVPADGGNGSGPAVALPDPGRGNPETQSGSGTASTETD